MLVIDPKANSAHRVLVPATSRSKFGTTQSDAFVLSLAPHSQMPYWECLDTGTIWVSLEFRAI